MYVPDAVKLAKFAKPHSLEPFTAGIATLIVHHLLIVVHLYTSECPTIYVFKELSK